MATITERVIRIDVVTSANAQRTIKALASDMAKVEKSTDQMRNSIAKGFGGIEGMFTKLSSFIGAFGLTTAFGAITRGVIEMASAYKILEDRFGSILGSAEKARIAVEDISEIALLTGRELDGVGKLYEKASRAAIAYGMQTSQVKEITLGFSQALRLSGASTQEAYAALVQFGQALASGRLQGDELRSILENNSVFMYELAAAAGKTVIELRKMGSEGKLGPKELFDIMTKRGEDGLNMLQRIDKKASEIPLTFSQSATAVGSAMTVMIGEIAKALNFIVDDKQGVFGTIIRALDARAQQLQNLNRINSARDDGWWEKFKRFYSTIFSIEGMGIDARTGETKQAFAVVVDAQVDAALKAYQEGAAKLEAERKRFAAAAPELTAEEAGRAPALQQMQAEVDQLYRSYLGLRSLQQELRYGERYEGPPVKQPTVDPEAERRLKNARESLKDFVEAREREAAANKLVLDGNVREAAVAKDLVELRAKLAAAGMSEASALGMRGRAAIESNAALKAELERRKDIDKFNKMQTEEYEKEADRVRERINRDTATMDALIMKTRSSQEFVTDELQRRRDELYTTLGYLSNFPIEDDPMIRSMRILLDLYDQAIAKRKELEGNQALIKQAELQKRIDLENEKRVMQDADNINESLKDAIKNGASGEALWDNLRRTFQDRTIDIVINPVTSILSRVLAQIADEFSRMLTMSLNLALSNQSSDPLGTLISLAGWGLSAYGGAGTTSSSSSMYALPTTGVKLGGYKDGLSYVPYDEFPAILHKGERVLTAEENAAYSRSGIVITNAPVINIDSSTDQAKIIEYVARGMEESQRAMWAQFKARGMV